MSKQKLAEKYLIEYSERLGIIAPRMITNLNDYRLFIALRTTHVKMPRLKHNLGRAFTELGVIWINTRKHEGAVTLRHTIAHELIHMKYPSVPHGIRFSKLTMQVISNRYVE